MTAPEGPATGRHFFSAPPPHVALIRTFPQEDSADRVCDEEGATRRVSRSFWNPGRTALRMHMFTNISGFRRDTGPARQPFAATSTREPEPKARVAARRHEISTRLGVYSAPGHEPPKRFLRGMVWSTQLETIPPASGRPAWGMVGLVLVGR